MPRVEKRTARQNIYAQGVLVDDAKTKSGKRRDRSVPADDQDDLLVAKGETYYTWKFRYGSARISKTYPDRSQLTQSEFMLRLYELEDQVTEFSVDGHDELESTLEALKEEIRDFAQEQEDKLYNMPDSLQQSETGQLLEQRAESLNEWADELDNVEAEFDQDRDEFDSDDEFEEARQEWLADRVSEIQEITHGL